MHLPTLPFKRMLFTCRMRKKKHMSKL